MEPLKSSYRDALKENHPGLSDEAIDLSEDLLAQRFCVDPEKEPERSHELDREREELLHREMPRYEKVIEKADFEERAARAGA